MFIALLFSFLSVPASALEPGSYQLMFQMASDVLDVIELEVVDVSTKPGLSYPAHGSFAIDISSENSYGNKQQRQIVRGSIYDGKFFFVIPKAHLLGVHMHSFEGTDIEKEEGVYSGTTTLIVSQRGTAKTGKPYRFTMRKRTR